MLSRLPSRRFLFCILIHHSAFIIHHFPMNIPPIMFPAKARHRRKRKAQSPSAAPPVGLVVTQIVNVSYDEPLLTFTVVFNTTEEAPLAGVGEQIDPIKWNARYQNSRFGGWEA